jgi:protein-S-isoprenylcysteine O-methyltransferase Ste14
MSELNWKAFGGLLNLLVCVGLAIFLPAWTLKYWQGWVFLGAFFLPVLAITLYLMKKDPSLLEKRVHAGVFAEKEKSQKIIQAIAGLAFIATIALPAFDRRFSWSAVPVYCELSGDALVLFGFLVVFLVFRVNTFASGAIEVASGQKVISTGPYAVVRHPMYAGALVMLFGVPVALGSWWGLLTLIPMTIVLIWRLVDEERFLASNLPGYSEYRDRVRYRLAPLVW